MLDDVLDEPSLTAPERPAKGLRVLTTPVETVDLHD